MKLLSLSIPEYGNIIAPTGIPDGSNLSLQKIVTFFLTLLVIAGILLALVFITFGAFQWITSGGSKEKIDKARKKFLFSVMGLVIISLSFVIIGLVAGALGLDSLIGN